MAAGGAACCESFGDCAAGGLNGLADVAAEVPADDRLLPFAIAGPAPIMNFTTLAL